MGKRLIDDALLTSPSLAACSPRAQDAFPRFLLLADDFGCFDSNPRVLAGRGWPLRADVTDAEISGWLEEYRLAGMLQLWSEGGRRYGHLLGWYGPHGQRKREEYSSANPKGSRRRTPAPPPLDAKPSESLPAQFPPGKTEVPPGKTSFPPLHDQSHDQSQVLLAGAVAPAVEPQASTSAQTPTPPPKAAQEPSQALLVPVPERPVKRAKRAKVDDKPTSPNYVPLRNRLVEGYERAMRCKYIFNGPVDTEAVKRLCVAVDAGDVTVEELGSRFERSLSVDFNPTTGIANFAPRSADPRWQRGSTRAEDQEHGPVGIVQGGRRG